MSLRGYKQTEEHIRNRMIKKIGSKHSVETKRKMSESKKLFFANGGISGAMGKHWKLSDEVKQKLSKIHKEKGHHPPIVHDEEAWQWKGDNVSYTGLHIWVSKKLGKSEKCDNCGSSGYYIFFLRYGKPVKKWSIDWANKSGKYKRDLSDWLPLCHKCHSVYDDNNPYANKTRA